MIVNRDINPERDFYYLGAKIIEIISDTEEKKYDFFSVFEKLKSSDNISINLFTLTLDWLFIIGAINKPVNGNIVKCF
jgi:hypothetical protein